MLFCLQLAWQEMLGIFSRPRSLVLCVGLLCVVRARYILIVLRDCKHYAMQLSMIGVHVRSN